MTTESFESKKAYHAMQAAFHEMTDSQQKRNSAQKKALDIYNEIGSMQAQLDKAQAELSAEWDEFNNKLNSFSEQIRLKIEAINLCNTEEEFFKTKAEDCSEEEQRTVYAEATRFFSKLASQKMLERDDLITKKRQLIAPDNSRVKEMIEKLKMLRSEQEDIVEFYHEAKNAFNLKKSSYDRLKAKYDSLKNSDSSQDVGTFSSRPRTMELDEDLLRLAKIPEEYWDDCKMSRRADGIVDIYYGGKEGVHHGHAVVDGESLKFNRKPKIIV